MQIKYSKIIPFPGFYAINLFGTFFIREEYKNQHVSKYTLNHESIHTEQMKDFCKLLPIGGAIFYILYILEWLIKCFVSLCTGFKVKAYRSISFEQEAYNREFDLTYLDDRKKFSWIKYIFKVVK